MAPRQKNYTVEEEVQVVRSYLNIAQDAVGGTEQTMDAFWRRIAAHFAENCRGPERTAKSIKGKWGAISHDVSKFVAAHATACDLSPSGTNEDDCYHRALEHYQDDHPKHGSFQFRACWEILRTVPKWSDLRKVMADEGKTDVNGDISVKDDEWKRPPGRKSEKLSKYKEYARIKEEKTEA